MPRDDNDDDHHHHRDCDVNDDNGVDETSKSKPKILPPKMAEFQRINKYHTISSFLSNGATARTKPGFHDHTQTHHTR
jgi:hypothetical protein